MRSELRAPRIEATLSGVVLPGLVSAQIDSNNHFAADRFHIRFAASVVPQDLLHLPGGEIEIKIGIDNEWLTCIVGLIDTVSADPTHGLIDVEGRDLSCRFIETQTDETFANQTASEIARLFGSRHGLIVVADPTVTPVGRYYQSEHDRANLSQMAKTTTEWDLLAFLAAREGFDMFMAGRVFRFGLPLITNALKIRFHDCISLQLGHCVGIARPINVLVKSWNSKTCSTISGGSLSSGVGPIWERRITRPNLSSADAQSLAQKSVMDLKRHEWTASLTIPGDLTLTARSLVLIEGTNTQWDRLYNVSQISRQVHVERGFTQNLSLQGIP